MSFDEIYCQKAKVGQYYRFFEKIILYIIEEIPPTGSGSTSDPLPVPYIIGRNISVLQEEMF